MTDGKESAYPQLSAATDWEGTPNGASESEGGITKREYFAALAMQGLCSHPEIGMENETKIAKVAVRQADALIAALNAD
jgi:hypothetical protein